MIVQTKETKGSQSLIELLGGNSKKTASSSSNDLFAKLLSSFGMTAKTENAKILKTDDTKTTKSSDFKTIIDPKNITVKTGETKTASSKTNTVELPSSQFKELQSLLGTDEQTMLLGISKELMGSLSENQMKTLIHKAKDYLKNEITSKNPDYQNDSKALPKTLGGLIQLADKLGLEPQKITLGTLITDHEEKAQFTPELLSKTLFDTKAIAALPAQLSEDTATIESITQLLSEFKNKEQKKSETISEDKTSVSDASEKHEKEPLKALLQKIEHPLKSEEEPSSAPQKEKNETIIPVAATTPKSDMLIALLQGNPESKESKSESASLSKIEGESQKISHLPKADSLEVKSKEASQSMRYFANDLKEAVQEYKPPFTRLTMKLNPEKLGEVEVTLVQRGNNVHVNIQSNNANSVAFLAHNARSEERRVGKEC